MASDQFRIKGSFDDSGVRSGAKGAQTAIKGLGASTDQQSRKLNKYGERLGKTFGKGQGLHGRLDNLEMPLRDAEGAFDRVQFAVREFGNAGATATDKISAGFLLAGDSIATFVSGGVIGVAIAGVVALGAAVFQSFSAASREAEEAQQAFKDLAAEAVRSSMSIRAVQMNTALEEKKAKARGIEETIMADKARLRSRLGALEVEQEELLRQEKVWREKRWGTAEQAHQRRRVAQAKSEWLTARRTLRQNEDLQKRVLQSVSNISTAVVRKAASDAMSMTGKALAAADKLIEKTETKTAKATGAKGVKVDASAEIAAAEAALKRWADDRAFEQQVLRENRAHDRSDREADLAHAREMSERKVDLIVLEGKMRRDEAAAEKLRQQKHLDDFHQAHATKIMVLGLMTNQLYDMAKAGEFSSAKLLSATLDAVGQEAVAKGTLHIWKGIASANPVEVAAGVGLVGLGVSLGAASGAVDRSAADQTAATSTTTTAAPADTRRSRAASSGSGGGDSGPVIIEFHGDVYDRRGVASVLSAGNRMSRHRRLAG